MLPIYIENNLKQESKGRIVCNQSTNGKCLVATKSIPIGELILRNEILMEFIDLNESWSDCSKEQQRQEKTTQPTVLFRMALNVLKRYPDMLLYLYTPSQEKIKMYELDETMKSLLPSTTFAGEVQTVMAMIGSNCFNHEEWIGLHTLISLANHSCDPNSVVIGNGLWAIKPIETGDEVTISYLSNQLIEASTVQERQTILKEKWEFDCRCVACTL